MNKKVILLIVGILLLVGGYAMKVMHWPLSGPIYYIGLSITIIVSFVIIVEGLRMILSRLSKK